MRRTTACHGPALIKLWLLSRVGDAGVGHKPSTSAEFMVRITRVCDFSISKTTRKCKVVLHFNSLNNDHF